MPRFRKAPSAAKAKAQVDKWNNANRVGTKVGYSSVRGQPPIKDTATKSTAFVAASGDPVIFVEGVSGFVSLDHITILEAV